MRYPQLRQPFQVLPALVAHGCGPGSASNGGVSPAHGAHASPSPGRSTGSTAGSGAQCREFRASGAVPAPMLARPGREELFGRWGGVYANIGDL